MPKVRASSGTMGTTSLPMAGSFTSFASRRTKAMVVETSRPSVPLANSANTSSSGQADGLRAHGALGQGAAQRAAALQHVLHLEAVLGRAVERGLADLVLRDGNVEAAPELAQLILVELLLLVRDVLAFARFAQAVALDRAAQDHGRGALRGRGGAVGGVRSSRDRARPGAGA
jgi:hypothetical protein